MLKSGGDFDISFLDVEMKGVSGLDVAKRIRQEQGGNGKVKSIKVKSVFCNAGKTVVGF